MAHSPSTPPPIIDTDEAPGSPVVPVHVPPDRPLISGKSPMAAPHSPPTQTHFRPVTTAHSNKAGKQPMPLASAPEGLSALHPGGPRSEISYVSRASDESRPLNAGGPRSDISFHSRASDDGGRDGGDSASDAGSTVTLDTTFSAETLASKASTSMHPQTVTHFFSLDDFAGHEIHAILETGEAEEEPGPGHGDNVDELSRPGSNISSIDERLGDIKGVKHVAPWDETAGPSVGGGAGPSSAGNEDLDPQPYVVGGYDADAEYALKREAMAKAAKAVRWAGGQVGGHDDGGVEVPGLAGASLAGGPIDLASGLPSGLEAGGLSSLKVSALMTKELLQSDEQRMLEAMQYRELTPADLQALAIAARNDEDERASIGASKRASESASEHEQARSEARSATVGSELDGGATEVHSVSSTSRPGSVVASSPAPLLHPPGMLHLQSPTNAEP